MQAESEVSSHIVYIFVLFDSCTIFNAHKWKPIENTQKNANTLIEHNISFSVLQFPKRCGDAIRFQFTADRGGKLNIIFSTICILSLFENILYVYAVHVVLTHRSSPSVVAYACVCVLYSYVASYDERGIVKKTITFGI